jgi:cell fate regulator YaaT (PSP1 superfamily)
MPDLYIVEFKGHRRGYYYNTYYHSLDLGNSVIVEAERGEDMGKLTNQVSDASKPNLEERPTSILRPATPEDAAISRDNAEAEKEALKRCEDLIAGHGLPMKLIGSEYQHDRNKLTFYFSSDNRIDFRALVRDLAAIYKTRIELRQIGVRDAARRLGGYGVCGRKQCCCSFLNGFEPISTQLAREQNLSLNPSKISGNCGRLLCCLTYEKQHYEEALKNFPVQGEIYTTDKGDGVIESINIFEDYMVVRHLTGEMEKVTLMDIKKRERRGKSFFKNWLPRVEKRPDNKQPFDKG